jgi:hypothetical protein
MNTSKVKSNTKDDVRKGSPNYIEHVINYTLIHQAYIETH